MARSPLFGLLRRVLASGRNASAGDGLTRRDLMTRTLGGVAIASLAVGCGDDDANDARDTRADGIDDGSGDTDASPDGTPDGGGEGARVVVVGAGMAGLHAAYRLGLQGVAATVYEAADRLGGRMISKRTGFADGQLCEIGGELIDTPHTIMQSLAADFDIQLDDFRALTPEGEIAEVYFFNGKAVSTAELLAEWEPLAPKLRAALDLAESDDAEFDRLDATSIPDFLADAGAGPLIKEVLEVAFNEEYGLEAREQPILNLLYLIDADSDDEFVVFGESDERFHTHLGNDTFITRLAAAIDGPIVKNAALVAVARDGDAYRLTFERQGDDAGTRFDVGADHVIFALPFTLLRKVDLSGVALPEAKTRIIHELGYGTNAKLMMQFSRRVWQTDHNASGATFADNGIQTSWDTTRGQDGAHGILTNFVGGAIGVAMGEGTAEERAQAILPAFESIFPGMTAAYVTGSATRAQWPTYPWTLGSYACYKLGQWAFYGLEGTRVDGLHFCGEHTSQTWQGYMEGAAESGVFAAIEVLEALGKSVPSSLRDLVADRDAPLPPEDLKSFGGERSARARAAFKASRVRRASKR